jgi:hypothetical protein
MDYPTEWVVEALLDRFPNWRATGRLTRDTRYGVVTLEVPAPVSADVERGLCIEAGEDITVSFDWFHTHYDPDVLHATTGDADDKGLDAASMTLALVEGIVAERFAAVSYWTGTELRGTTLMHVGSRPFDGSLDEKAVVGMYTISFRRIRVRSWQGTLDKDLERA